MTTVDALSQPDTWSPCMDDHASRRTTIRAASWWRRVLVVGLVVWVGIAMALPAAAARRSDERRLDVEQPEVLPRVLPKDILFGFYPGPDGSADLAHDALERTALRVYADVFGHDARTIVGETSVASLEERGRDDETPSHELTAQQLEIGRQFYRMGDIADAIRALESALTTAMRGTLRWSRPALMAESLETLALAYQEAGAGRLQSEAQAESQTRVALRELIRLRPTDVVDESRYPLSFVTAWRQAYYEQMLVSAAMMSIRIEEARAATALIDVDTLVDLRLLYGQRGSSIALRVYDAVEDRFAYDGLLAWDGSEAHLEDTLSKALASARDCMKVRRPEAPEGRKRLLHSNYLHVGWTAFMYLDTPTEHVFLNQGARIGGQHYVTPVVGFFADLSIAFSSRDREGILLSPVQQQAMSAGVSLQYAASRFRIHLDVGAELARRTDIVATRSFWCRVSGGEPREYGSGRACLADDVFRQKASGLVGMNLRTGLAVRVVGPVWMHAMMHSTLYLFPFGNRGLDRPLGGTVGFSYAY